MKNIANSNSTNKFVNVFGALNLANIKLSGLYKIVVDINNKLFLDNYNGYRIILETNKAFLPQVADFLKNSPNSNTKNINTKNAGYRNRSLLSWHTPIYLGEDKSYLPTHFLINSVKNDNISDISDIQKYNKIIYFKDIRLLGLTKIFNEIIDNQKNITPIFFNWSEEKLIFRGYDLKNKTNTSLALCTLNIQSNQNLIENSNNKILNTFVENFIIVPNFINVEFEFEFNNNTGQPFNNFNGFFSSAKNINKETYTDDATTVTLFEYDNKTIKYQQETVKDLIQEIPYQDIVVTSNIQIPTKSIPQVNIKISLIQNGDKFKILFPLIGNEIEPKTFFEYIVKVSDIKNTLLETMNFIAKNILKLSNNSVVCEFNDNTKNFKIKIMLPENNNNPYSIVVLKGWTMLDKTNKFESITTQDIRVISTNSFNTIYDTQNVTQCLIGEEKFNINKGFYFEGYLILRLTHTKDNRKLNNKTFFSNKTKNVSLFINKIGQLTQLKPKPYLGFNTSFDVVEQYNKTKYIESLVDEFGETTDPTKLEAFNKAIESFGVGNNFVDQKPYIFYETISENINIVSPTNIVNKNSKNNDTNILDVVWGDGINAYLTPNTLNLDYRFYDKNANINSLLGVNEPARFHWFLIKGEAPKYISDDETDIRNLRYFTVKPKLTTQLKKSTQTTDYCETTFLGIKYILPQKYNGYSFAVYLEYENLSSPSVQYYCTVNDLEKTIYVIVSKYLDFVDLIRGGDSENAGVVDLSLFYTVTESYNNQSELNLSFTTGAILLFDTTKPVNFNNRLITDWKYYDFSTNKWYVCVKRSNDIITQNFDEIVTLGDDFSFFVYSNIKIHGIEYSYASLKYVLKNPFIVSADYVWCEDVNIIFFDTKNIFVNEILPENPDLTIDNYLDVFPIAKTELTIQPTENGSNSGNYFQAQEFETIWVNPNNNTNHTLRLINYDNTFSIKKEYFDFSQDVYYDENGNKSNETDYFVFPEYKNYDLVDYDYLDNLFQYGSFDNLTSAKISILDRNQLWRLICDIAKFGIVVKNQSKKQTLSSVNELLVTRLQEYMSINSLRIINVNNNQLDKYAKILVADLETNAVIWKNENGVPKVTKIQRHSGNYSPQLIELQNELFLQNENTHLKNNFSDNIYNLYSDNFNGVGISGTGFWQDVNNIVSSLWCSKITQLKLTLPIEDGKIYNLIDIVKRVVPIEEAKLKPDFIDVNGNVVIDNHKTILVKDANINDWIHTNYVIWLLNNIWELSNVLTINNERILFDNIDEYNIILKDKSFYHQTFNEATFIFERK